MIRILILFVVGSALWAQIEVLPMRFANLPACAAPFLEKGPKADSSGDYLLLRVQDRANLGLEIWCAREAAGYAYQYRLVGGEGRSVLLDRCQFPEGINSAGVEHEGPVAELTLPNGGLWLRTAGKLVKFQHHNWDTQRGHHAVYDFARQTLTIYRTRAERDGAGRWVRVLAGADSMPLGEIPQQLFPEAMGKNLPGREFDPRRVGCISALADEGFRMREQEVDAYVAPNQAGKVTVAWPESSPVQSLFFDPIKRELRLKLMEGTRKAIVSLAVPRTMLGLGRELAHVRLDGRFVMSDEMNTATHKTIRFVVEEPVKEVLLKESQGFPFFVVTMSILVGAVLIGGVIGLLFRRKLPAVPDEAA